MNIPSSKSKFSKSRIKNYKTTYCLRHLILGNYQYADATKEQRIFACKMYIQKFCDYSQGQVLASHEAELIAGAKDKESQVLFLDNLRNNKVILYCEAYVELLKKVDIDLLGDLNYKEDYFYDLFKE